MTPGPAEEVGKVANNAIEVLRRDPFYLALLLLTAFFGGLTFYAYQLDAGRRSRTVDILLEKCIPYVAEVKQESHPKRDEGGQP